MKKRNRKTMIAVLLSMLLLVGCTNDSAQSDGNTNVIDNSLTSDATDSSTPADNSTTSDGTTNVTYLADSAIEFDTEDFYSNEIPSESTKITLNKTSAEIDGSGASQENSVVTIIAAGVYVISGTLSDGQIIVNAGEKDDVQLILNGVSLYSTNSAPIYVQQADKVTISLPEGTNNTLSDTENYVLMDTVSNEPSATIFSKSDLVINGTGTLSIEANYNDAITSKDDIKITDSTIVITSVDDGIIGRDMIATKDVTITIKADGDGMKSSNDEDASKGFIAIEGGSFDITAGTDGIQAETSILITNGDIQINSGGGSINASTKTDNGFDNPFGDRGNVDAASTTSTTTTTEVSDEISSAKGLKAISNITINGGTLSIDSSDDAIHSNGSITIANGTLDLSSGDDGIHADAQIQILSGNITIMKSYEGIESSIILIEDGNIQVTASDDGINVSGGADSSSVDGRPGENTFQSTSNDNLTVNGGYLYVNAVGDGLDSNGSVYITGGTVIVNGPTNDGNGPLDYQGSFDISGGYLIAAGSSGMAQAPADVSSQSSIGVLFTQTQAAGTIVHIEDSNGDEIATFAPAKEFSSVVVSTPEIKNGEPYTIYTGGSSTGSEANGLYTDGTYQKGTLYVEFTVSDIVTWVNDAGITTQQEGFGPGGMGGGKMGDGGFGGDFGGGKKPQ